MPSACRRYVPRNYTLPHYQKIFQSPGVLLMLNEFIASYRQILIDGRPLPVDPQPSMERLLDCAVGR
jgi:hypothetical protein